VATFPTPQQISEISFRHRHRTSLQQIVPWQSSRLFRECKSAADIVAGPSNGIALEIGQHLRADED